MHTAVIGMRYDNVCEGRTAVTGMHYVVMKQCGEWAFGEVERWKGSGGKQEW